MTGAGPDWRVLAAGALILLALGLPWSPSSLEYVPGWVVPSFCTTSWDGTMWCSGGYVSPGMWFGTGEVNGASSVARVFLVGAGILLLIARGRSRFLLTAAGLLLAGLLLHGLGMLGGQIAAVAAIVLLVGTARSAGQGFAAERSTVHT